MNPRPLVGTVDTSREISGFLQGLSQVLIENLTLNSACVGGHADLDRCDLWPYLRPCVYHFDALENHHPLSSSRF